MTNSDPTPSDPLAVLAAAARRSINGSAEVEIEVKPPFADESTVMTGPVDFASDRCQLDGRDVHVRMAGSATYSLLDDGRWSHQTGAPGAWGTLHPRWLLESLIHAQTSAKAIGEGEFSIDFDRAALGERVNPGVDPGWNVTGTAALGHHGRVEQLSVCFSDPSADQSMRITAEFSYRSAPIAIELPGRKETVELSEYLRQLRLT